jgi:hypothetical protein
LLEGSVLSSFLFSLVFTLIWELFPAPVFPSHQTFLFRLAAIWILAFADDLAVICPSAVRLSRCLTWIRRALSKLWLAVSLKKTEVVRFARPSARTRRYLTVRIGTDVVPRAASFKYLGVTITAKGQLTVHQKAVHSKARVAAYEVAKLLRKLQITSFPRLASYLQTFVDGQYYGIEHFPMHAALDIDSSRKLFVCTCFNLPSHTAKTPCPRSFCCCTVELHFTNEHRSTT